MSAAIDTLRMLVHDMLAPARDVNADALTALADEDWQAIRKMTRQHRLGPMLHHRDRVEGERWPLPGDIRALWREEHGRATFRALQHERTLHMLAAKLAAADIQFVALKGSWLAWNAYPHPALRPMRDIDILVAAEHALAVRTMMLEAGFVQTNPHADPPERALALKKHLPSIISPEGVVLEIHTHLTDHFGSEEEAAIAAADRDEQLLHRISGQVGGHPIYYLSPTDTLLHLVVHSAYDHRLNNGPAIFDDIAFTLKNHAIDWERFWFRAGARGWTAGSELLLLIAIRQHGALPISWKDGQMPKVDEDTISSALQLSLQDHKERDLISLMGKAAMRGRGASRHASGFVATRHQLAPLIGVQPGNPLAWLGYPIWLFGRASRAVGGLQSGPARADSVKYAAVSRFLDNR
jgi:Uncharacterised nucleotidyltransferase